MVRWKVPPPTQAARVGATAGRAVAAEAEEAAAEAADGGAGGGRRRRPLPDELVLGCI